VFDRIVNTLSGSVWTYAMVAAVSAIDAVFPVVPADAAVVTAAVLAAQGSLSIVLVGAAGLVGATAGRQRLLLPRGQARQPCRPTHVPGRGGT
jgi:membrane-associated protein